MTEAMKKILNVLCVAAAIVALASCAKDSLGFKVKGTEKTFTAGFGIATDGTRTAIDDKYKTTWVANDKIKIYNTDGDDDTATVSSEDDGKYTATITSTIAESNNYYAIYGGESYTEGGDSFFADINSEQSGTWADAQVAAAIAIDKVFSFKNISSVIEFSLATSDVKNVTFISDDEFVNSTSVSFNKSGEPELETQSTTGTISVNTEKGAGKYYAAIFPSEVSKLTIQLEYEGEVVKEIVIDTPLKFAADTVFVLGELESHVSGLSYKLVKKESFNAVSGNLDDEGAFTYKANQGGAGTAPGIYNNGIRLYQGKPGGNLEITSNNGDKIKGIKITTTKTYSTSYIDIKEDGAATNINDTISVKFSSTKAIGGLDANKVTIYNYGNSSSERIEIYAITVVYAADTRTAQELSFPKASYSVKTGETFEAPTVSGAQTTVTYATTDPDVATVDAATGAVTIIGAGVCTISATAEATTTYKEGFASYDLTVATGVKGVAGIKAFLAGKTNVDFVAEVEDLIVTYKKDDAYPHIAYAEDKDGDAIYFYFGNNTLPIKEGDKINGSILCTGTNYKNSVQITAIDLSSATVTTGSIDPVEVTIENIINNFADYEYRKCKIVDATVTKACTTTSSEGTIEQSGNSITLYSGQKGFVVTTVDAVCDFICFPYINDTNKNTMIWEQSQVTVKGGANTITMTTAKSLNVGEEWTLDGTCLSGTVSYTITEGSDVVSLSSGVVTGLKAGTAKIKATSPATGSYTASEATCSITVNSGDAVIYEKFTGTLAEGDYLIIADSVAMNTTVSSDRIQYDKVTITSNTVSNPDSTLIWHIAKSGDYWTIYNVKEAKYLASTGAKNKAGFLKSGTDDKSLWSYTSGAWVNKKNTANKVNATLRRNDTYGFACYGASTGSAPVLYKKK